MSSNWIINQFSMFLIPTIETSQLDHTRKNKKKKSIKTMRWLNQIRLLAANHGNMHPT